MLTEAIERYIALRQATGFQFRIGACLLRNFAQFAQSRSECSVQATTAVAWATLAPSAAQRRRRLLVVCRFAQHAHLEDALHQVPSAEALGGATAPRRRPHLFSPEQVECLLASTSKLRSRSGLRAHTYATLFGLLAATGLRISEALALDREDLGSDGLRIRMTKFRKSRLVPLHSTTRSALERYLVVRVHRVPNEAALFVSERWRRLTYQTVNVTFLALVRSLGWHPGKGHKGLRLHDLRHSFAVRSLEQCLGTATQIERHMLALSTYLGHAHVADTYWYLEATPRLLETIAERAEALHTGGA